MLVMSCTGEIPCVGHFASMIKEADLIFEVKQYLLAYGIRQQSQEPLSDIIIDVARQLSYTEEYLILLLIEEITKWIKDTAGLNA